MKILYEDGDILVCYKEAGLAVQNARVGSKDLESILKMHLRKENPQGGVPYLAVVHRLDQPVEGVLVFAKNKKAAGVLSKEAQDGRMEKVYRARCVPDPDKYKEEKDLPEEGTLTDFLLKDGRTNMSRAVSEKTPGAKKAVLRYRKIREESQDNPGTVLYEIRLLTGRHHQIRVQMAHAGLPLSGDRKYGSMSAEEHFPALCAFRLSFIHPRTGRKMDFHL